LKTSNEKSQQFAGFFHLGEAVIARRNDEAIQKRKPLPWIASLRSQ
jgi:hypothetical protein